MDVLVAVLLGLVVVILVGISIVDILRTPDDRE